MEWGKVVRAIDDINLSGLEGQPRASQGRPVTRTGSKPRKITGLPSSFIAFPFPAARCRPSCTVQRSRSSSFHTRNARWYDPSIGRFLSRDPVDLPQPNYVFCGNDPVNKVDPSGNYTIDKKSCTQKQVGLLTVNISLLKKRVLKHRNELSCCRTAAQHSRDPLTGTEAGWNRRTHFSITAYECLNRAFDEKSLLKIKCSDSMKVGGSHSWWDPFSITVCEKAFKLTPIPLRGQPFYSDAVVMVLAHEAAHSCSFSTGTGGLYESIGVLFDDLVDIFGWRRRKCTANDIGRIVGEF